MGFLRRYLLYFLVVNGIGIGGVLATDKLIPKKVQTTVITPQSPIVAPQQPLKKEGPWVESPWDPPPEFVYYSTKYSLHVMEVPDANIACREAFRNMNRPTPPNTWRLNACAIRTVDRNGNMRHCQIIVPIDNGTLPKKKYQALRDHELAHCNGWEHP